MQITLSSWHSILEASSTHELADLCQCMWDVKWATSIKKKEKIHITNTHMQNVFYQN